jgi:hypothetical protein
MLGRRASLFGELARLPDSITRVGIINYTGSQQIFGYAIFALKVKLPRLMSHPEDSGGTINRQSAIKQLQKRKEPHHEKAKHLSESKSRTS